MDVHLRRMVVKMGGIKCDSHPSTFWFEDRKLLLTIYVDDLMLSGPTENHERFWRELGKDVFIEPPEDLDRFLGRHHDICACDAPEYDVKEFFDAH